MQGTDYQDALMRMANSLRAIHSRLTYASNAGDEWAARFLADEWPNLVTPDVLAALGNDRPARFVAGDRVTVLKPAPSLPGQERRERWHGHTGTVITPANQRGLIGVRFDSGRHPLKPATQWEMVTQLSPIDLAPAPAGVSVPPIRFLPTCGIGPIGSPWCVVNMLTGNVVHVWGSVAGPGYYADRSDAAAFADHCNETPESGQEHEHTFPVGEPDAAGYVDPADCACGMTYAQYDSEMGERIADALESEGE
jgi:hypothetical protein